VGVSVAADGQAVFTAIVPGFVLSGV
jgi:hypothetical protein